MALSIGGTNLPTNGTTAITIVASPATGAKREVTSVKVNNRDDATAHVRISILDSATTTVVASDTALAIGATLKASNIVLDSTTKSVQVVLNAAVNSTELDASSSFVEITS